jgi:uncharacterized protein YdaU (DUF1376 family)
MMDKPKFDVQYFPFYVSRWRDSEARINLNMEQRGLYLELLFYCYRAGSLPKDRQSLVKVAAVSEKEFDRAWPHVKELFYEEGGRLHHGVVDQTIKEIEVKHTKRVKAGAIGGLKKASNARAMLEQDPSNALPLRTEQIKNKTEQNKDTDTPPPAAGLREQLFDEFWSIVWAKIGVGAARKAWKAKVKGSKQARRVIEAAKQQGPGILQKAADNGIGVLHPATWLNQERYEDETRPLVAAPVERIWTPEEIAEAERATDEEMRRLTRLAQERRLAAQEKRA